MNEVQQINVEVPNTPGSLSAICDALEKADIDIIGLCCTEDRPNAVWHFIVDKPEVALDTLKKLGKTITTTTALVFSVKDRPGIIAAIARKCFESGINIGNIYTATAGRTEPTLVYMWVDQPHMEEAKTACAALFQD